MSEPIWNKFLTDRDKEVFAVSGYAERAGFGKRPALLVIDVNYFFCGDKPEPILESIKRWPNSCGQDAWDALPTLAKVIETAREREIPVIYTTGIRRADNWDRGSWAWKNRRSSEAPKLMHTNQQGDEIMPLIAPGFRDIVIYKRKPSGFHGTDLLSYLTLLSCDSVVVMGTTTSGCVRATVLDSFSFNLHTIVVEDGCFDRSQASHALSLCDMNAKYADVVKSDEVLTYLQSLPKGMFDLPAGASQPPLQATSTR